MAPVAATRTDTSGEVGLPRRRGKSQAPNFKYTGPMSLNGLEFDASDEQIRWRLEKHWNAVFRFSSTKRVSQRTAADGSWLSLHESILTSPIRPSFVIAERLADRSGFARISARYAW